MSRVSISRKTAEALLQIARACKCPGPSPSIASIGEVERALTPKRSVKLARQRKETKRKSKKEETAEIYIAVTARARGLCELCGYVLELMELHHVFGRKQVRQSVRNCLFVCRPCHQGITHNLPSRAYWMAAQGRKLSALGFHSEAARAQREAEWSIAKKEIGAAP